MKKITLDGPSKQTSRTAYCYPAFGIIKGYYLNRFLFNV